MKPIGQQSSRRAALSAAAGILLVLALSAVCRLPVTALGEEVPDVSSAWNWTSHTNPLTPSCIEGVCLPERFPIWSGGPVPHVIYNTLGALNIVQKWIVVYHYLRSGHPVDLQGRITHPQFSAPSHP
jgi:hypothetical protein